MAYIPDAAFDDIAQVGEKAFRLYCFYCKHGSMSNNRVTVSLYRAASFMNIAYENVCRLNAKLKKAGWIKAGLGETILLKGFEKLTETSVKTDENVSRGNGKLTNSSVKTDRNVSFDPNEPSKTDENVSYDEEKLIETSVKTDEFVSFENGEKPKTDENVSRKLTNSSVAYKEEPAPLNQNTQKACVRGAGKRIKENNSEREREQFELKFFDGLQEKLLCTPFEFPKWQITAEFLFEAKASSSEALEYIDWLKTDESQSWRKGRLTPEIVANNFVEFRANRTALPPKIPDVANCTDCKGQNFIKVGGAWKPCEHPQLSG